MNNIILPVLYIYMHVHNNNDIQYMNVMHVKSIAIDLDCDLHHNEGVSIRPTYAKD